MADPIRLYLVRHGEAAQSWTYNNDSELSDIGHEQAAKAARTLADLGPLPLISSPLRRARETATAFERQWRISTQIEYGVREIPSPHVEPKNRDSWLKERLVASWNDIQGEPIGDETLGDWRTSLLRTLVKMPTSALITTHFVVINAAVGAATDDNRVVCFRPDHASCTIMEIIDNRLALISLGKEMFTEVG